MKLNSLDLTINPEAYYRPLDAAKRLGVSARWLQYDRSGKQLIPFHKLGKQVIYFGSDLLNTLEKSRISTEVK